MKKSLIIIGIVFMISIVLFGIGCIWAKGLKEDQKETKAKMKLVLEAYPSFNESVNGLADKRNILYEYRDELYFETLSESTEVWNKFMEEYAEGIKNVESTAKVLKDNCKVKYGDVGTNSKCTAFKANYEAAHNYYITDVTAYNKLVDNYDEWNKENGGKYKSINKAGFPVYKKYIDFDNDGEYFGKEVEVSYNE